MITGDDRFEKPAFLYNKLVGSEGQQLKCFIIRLMTDEQLPAHIFFR
jgi:hypothetical protein